MRASWITIAALAACGNDPVLVPDAGPDAASYTWQPETSATTSALFGAWASGAGDVFAVGDDVYHSSGAGWSVHDPAARRAISGRGPGDVYAVGEVGAIARFDGGGWAGVTSPVSSLLSGVWAGDGEAIAVGTLGAVIRDGGGGWTSEAAGGGNADLLGVWGGGGEAFVVGAGGTVRHRAGGVWSPGGAGTTALLSGVWGSGPDDVFVVGGDLVGGRTILHWDGVAWSVDEAAGETLYAVWGTAGDDVYAVGRAGTILHFDGVGWRAENAGTTEDLYAITGAGDEVWIVGGAGITLRRVR